MTRKDFHNAISKVSDQYGWVRRGAGSGAVRYLHGLSSVSLHKMSFTVTPNVNYTDVLYVSNPLFITRQDDNLDSHLKWAYLRNRRSIEAAKFGDFQYFYKRFGVEVNKFIGKNELQEKFGSRYPDGMIIIELEQLTDMVEDVIKYLTTTQDNNLLGRIVVE